MRITPEHCKMARAGLGLSVKDLSEKAEVGLNTVIRFENGADTRSSSIDKIQKALEALGAEFSNGDAIGVRVLRDR